MKEPSTKLLTKNRLYEAAFDTVGMIGLSIDTWAIYLAITNGFTNEPFAMIVLSTIILFMGFEGGKMMHEINLEEIRNPQWFKATRD